MTTMPEGREIERFGWVLGPDGGVHLRDDGEFVRYSDHQAALERVEAERDRAIEYAEATREDFERLQSIQGRALAAEQALEEVRGRLDCVIAEEHGIQAELENRDQAWMATRLSYCTGGLVNLRAALAHEEQER